MFWKKKTSGTVCSPCVGQVIKLEDVPDPVFSEKMLGDGVAVLPENGTFYSPVDGKIVQVFDTKHAYSIMSDDGLEILVHIGLNTVELKGKGFTSFVKDGDTVKKGDKIAEVNLEYISDMGYQLYTPVLITNMSDIKKITINETKVEATDNLIKYEK